MRADEGAAEDSRSAEGPSSDPAPPGHLLPQVGEGRAPLDKCGFNSYSLPRFRRMGRLRWVGGVGGARFAGTGGDPLSKPRDATSPALVFLRAEAFEKRRGPGRISEGGAGTYDPKGGGSLAPEAANSRKGDRGPERYRLRRSILYSRPKTAPRRSGPPIPRAGNGGGDDHARPRRGVLHPCARGRVDKPCRRRLDMVML